MARGIRPAVIRIALLTALIMVAITLAAASLASEATPASPETAVARPSANGRLHVEGERLVDEAGAPLQLRGVSTHGLTWFPDFIDEGLFKQLAGDWDCNLVRLPVYSSVYCGSAKAREESLSLLHKGIQAAIAADMYVIVDWHVLEDSDPNAHSDAAAEFFASISSKYADCPNLIFEICNEPNGTANWSDIVRYSQKIIPVIRGNVPGSVILVGTPDYDRILSDAVLRPLEYDDVMYVLHFYAASHREGLMEELDTAVRAGLPVFISECSFCEASGDGDIDFSSAVKWFEYLNAHQLSYAIWNLSDKAETSAFFAPGFDPSGGISDRSLTVTGQWARELIRGTAPGGISIPDGPAQSKAIRRIQFWITNSLGERGYTAVLGWTTLAGIAALILLAFALTGVIYLEKTRSGRKTYDIACRDQAPAGGSAAWASTFGRIALFVSAWCTVIYLGWRIRYSIPAGAGALPVVCNLLLLVVEVFGFFESVSMFMNLMGMRDHPLPVIPEEAYPDVDVFIATYNEPEELLRRTINGCRHMKYPDPGKVHIWICDDNRRQAMRELADEMGVGYFDRPDNKGAKAGNLNHAMSLTSAPYIVTFDADMIPKSDFLLKTIPYFVDMERRNRALPEAQQTHLGFLQTPQSFYQPDIYQHALYSEKNVPNEQDFFYRTIEPSRTSTNSVIYGGSNTVLSRKALEDAGGFYTESITEDIATGILIQSRGYVSLALPEPLANGQTPQSFREHIKQRTRWGRGVIATLRQIKLWKVRGLALPQKISYWSSGVYWYSPIKSMVYILSPLMFAVLGIPVFRCNWLELLVFWLPMFLMQDINLRVNSRGRISLKWNGIYETSVMPYLFIPILKESLGITMSSFKVTDKSGKAMQRQTDLRAMLPFLVLIGLSAIGIIRLILRYEAGQGVSFLILMFWILRNLYFLILSVFLVDGRDSDGEIIKVCDAEEVVVESRAESGNRRYEGVTTLMTEHNLTVFLDGEEKPGIGAHVDVTIRNADYTVRLKGVVTGARQSRNRTTSTQTIEILDDCGNWYEYLSVLYDRVPTLPQALKGEVGIVTYLWKNIAQRLARVGQV